ncbi:TetR family transcriptional regulator [Sphaerisporangium album]|uniref:TetR family transcriptional regulator n=1 Tax=Sphaerisporangium album TaxID=509200 RepID=A0A367FD57_9ACTN|nr:TetR family transcriptional regulator [Sphaerisporangium album]
MRSAGEIASRAGVGIGTLYRHFPWAACALRAEPPRGAGGRHT